MPPGKGGVEARDDVMYEMEEAVKRRRRGEGTEGSHDSIRPLVFRKSNYTI
jgi:hypothetical protein